MKKYFVLLPLVLIVFGWKPAVQADQLTFGLDIEFSGATSPQGSTPWISATFDDSFGESNTVRLTMKTDNLTGDEFIKEWYFNFDPALDPEQLTFTVVDNTDSVPNSILVGIDAFQADGDGKFDILFDFPPPPGTFNEKFTAGEKVIYDITYTAPITVAAFDFYSAPAGGKGPFKSAAHVLGIGNDGNDSGWIGTGVGTTVIPEPGTMLLFGSGLLGLAGLHRRKSKVR